MVVVAVVMSAAVATLKYAVMPKVHEHEAELQARLSAATGMAVSAESIRGGWRGFSPFVEMTGVDFREAKVAPAAANEQVAPGALALRLPIVRASVSIPFLMIGQLRFSELVVYSPQLSLLRAADGYIYFAGRPLNKKTAQPDVDRLIEWLLSQPGIEIHHATLTWQDDTTTAPALLFSDVGIRIDKSLGRHNFGFKATPPLPLAREVEVRGRVRIDRRERKSKGSSGWDVQGSVFASASDANLGELRRHLNVPDNWQSGVGTVRAWVELDTQTAMRAANDKSSVSVWVNPVKSIVADVAIINARAQLADDVAPLAIAKLAGRLTYERLENGFRVGSKKLEFRTDEGVNSPSADFSLSLQDFGVADKERGEVTANGIDLKVMTSLIEYFPIGRDVRQLAAKFGLRGAVKDSRFAWTGSVQQPLTYQVKGTLVDFASNRNDAIPGVVGFTGSIEANEKGGSYTVRSKALTLDIPSVFRNPLRLDALDGKGAWQVTDNEVTLKVAGLRIVNRDLNAELNGTYTRLRERAGREIAPDKRPGTLDLTLKIAEASAKQVPSYFPNDAAATRDYLEWAIRGGKVEDAVLSIKGEVYDFPYRNGQGGAFTVRAKLKDIEYRYADGWPSASNIDAELLIDNTAIRAKIDAARIFNAKIRNTELWIADTQATPSIVSIVGEADARAEDVTRYLRESPLVTTIGAFTKVVALEGSGKLNLDLKIPFGHTATAPVTKQASKLTVSGRYALTKGNANLAFGMQIGNLGGSIAFTEASIKSTNLTGVAFGAPMAINIVGGGDAGVTIDFVGRADVQQLGDLLPFRMPRQVTGSTDVVGRVTSTRAGVDVVVDASMAGVVSTLPAPLAKRPDEVRRLNVSLSNVGQPDEKIRLSMAGNATGTALDAPESRIEARFQRKDATRAAQFQGLASVGAGLGEAALADGLWLAGNLRHLDFDLWLRAVSNFYPKPAAGDAPAPESVVAGFDFSLERLSAYGRQFSAVKIRGRKTSDRANPIWALNVVSKEAEGDFTWRSAAYAERGAVRARLKRLVLADEVNAAQVVAAGSNDASADAQQLPALDIVADEFNFKERWLGKLELKATPQAENWRIEQLVISNGHARAEMEGLWQRYGDPFAAPRAGPVKSLTSVNIKVESSNLNALFAQFGYGDQMRGGRGGLEGKLSWPGHSYQFQTANLSGAFKVNADRGQFAKFEPGAGKLLGLMSLQSIPRRLSFDFRDLFSEGYAFDRIEGDLSITDGIMLVKKFDIAGPAADVRMSGDVALPTERVNLTITVAPKLSTMAAVGAGVLVNPLVGLGVLLGGEVLKAPLERVLSVQYAVSGKWDNPDVERIGRITVPIDPKTIAPATAPALAPALTPVSKAVDTKPTDDRNKKNAP